MNPLDVPTRSRVLVVDDVPKNLQVVGTMLRNDGYEVMPAISGADALEGVREQLPDLILLDLMMPEMDGLEVCRRLKADAAFRAVPIIFLTASNEMEHLVKGFEAGAVDYITKPFNAPELLARVRTHLELRHARERLREMNDEKNEFMGIAAHDLRNPLSAIRGFSEMIAENAHSLRLEEVKNPAQCLAEVEEFSERIRTTTARMMEMVQNLLDVNAIERGEMNLNLAPADLGSLLPGVVEAHRSRAVAKAQRLELHNDAGSAEVLIDRIVMVQILDNLISNAVKYSPHGKTIDVCLRKSTDLVRCEVRDEGPGLTVHDQKRLFGKFARLSAKPTGGEHSTGLGLSIVKRLVEAMRGRVWCESHPGQGATFIVTLPRVEPG